MKALREARKTIGGCDPHAGHSGMRQRGTGDVRRVVLAGGVDPHAGHSGMWLAGIHGGPKRVDPGQDGVTRLVMGRRYYGNDFFPHQRIYSTIYASTMYLQRKTLEEGRTICHNLSNGENEGGETDSLKDGWLILYFYQ